MHLGLWSTQTSQVVFSGNSPTSQACFNNQRSWLLKGEAKKKKKKSTFVILHFVGFTLVFQASENIWNLSSDSD